MIKSGTILVFFFFAFIVLNGQDKELNTELIFNVSTLKSKGLIELKSMEDGERYSVLKNEENSKVGSEINIYSYKTGELLENLANSKTIFGSSAIEIGAYEISESENKLILKTAIEEVYRHSDLAHYFIYDLNSNLLSSVSDSTLGKISLGFLSPGGSYFSFVRNNDLYYINLKTKEEIRISFDGKKNEIINGAVDWVYEEEFGNHIGYYWSPNGGEIAYYRFDEREVKMASVTKYGNLYPTQTDFKYPKAGEVNSKVSIQVYSITNQETHGLATHFNEYIPRIKWTKNSDELVIMRLNRHQNHLEMLLFDVSNKADSGRIIYNETSTTFIDVNDNLIFLEDAKHFIWNSEKDGFNHIYLYTLNGELVKQLTSGNWDVATFYGVDQKRERIYFTASIEKIQNLDLYYTNFKGGLFKKLSHQKGTNTPHFSKTFNYYINDYSSVLTPNYFTLHNHKGKEIRVIEKNIGLQAEIENYNLPDKEFFYFQTERGDSLHAFLIKPKSFDASKEYPVLLYQYGGPGSFKTDNKWGGEVYLWLSMLSQKGMLVICVDPRGTARRGKEWRDLSYLKLGELEIEDFVSASKYMRSLPYVKKDKIFIYGKSYGGFMALNCITQGADYFDAAVSLASVTNWGYYDDIYIERYMRTPQENPEGYARFSPINHVDKLNAPLLLIHGSSDDNVHLQNSMDFISEAVRLDKHFDFFIYPNENHKINKGASRKHVFEKITRFLLEQMEE
jgi:dipeptidyl-peptidase-4